MDIYIQASVTNCVRCSSDEGGGPGPGIRTKDYYNKDSRVLVIGFSVKDVRVKIHFIFVDDPVF